MSSGTWESKNPRILGKAETEQSFKCGCAGALRGKELVILR